MVPKEWVVRRAQIGVSGQCGVLLVMAACEGTRNDGSMICETVRIREMISVA